MLSRSTKHQVPAPGIFAKTVWPNMVPNVCQRFDDVDESPNLALACGQTLANNICLFSRVFEAQGVTRTPIYTNREKQKGSMHPRSSRPADRFSVRHTSIRVRRMWCRMEVWHISSWTSCLRARDELGTNCQNPHRKARSRLYRSDFGSPNSSSFRSYTSPKPHSSIPSRHTFFAIVARGI